MLKVTVDDVIYAIAINDNEKIAELFVRAKLERNWEAVKCICDMSDDVIDPVDAGRMIPNPFKPIDATISAVLVDAQAALDAIPFWDRTPRNLQGYVFNLKRVFLIDAMKAAIADDDQAQIQAIFNQARKDKNWEVIKLACDMPSGPSKPADVSNWQDRRIMLFQSCGLPGDPAGQVYYTNLQRLLLIEDIKEAIVSDDPTNATEIKDLFRLAKKNKNWEGVKLICDMSDGVKKPAGSRYEDLYEEIKAQALGGNPDAWNDLYQMSSLFLKEERRPLQAGPLPKTSYTKELEAFFRELVMGGDFTIMHPTPGEDVYTFTETGHEYTWSEILKHADFTHLELTPEDLLLYQGHKRSLVGTLLSQDLVDMFTASNLDRACIQSYWDGLYRDYPVDKRPTSGLSFEEMGAIANYTGHAYKIMNALIRGEVHDETWFWFADNGYQADAHKAIRLGLMESIVCCSALTKLPEVAIKKEVYRGKGTSPDDIEYYVDKAAREGVVSLVGLTSTSVHRQIACNWARPGGMLVHFSGRLKGVYVAPVSKNASEGEFLIPPVEVRCVGYRYEGDMHEVDFDVVTDIGYLETANRKRLYGRESWSLIDRGTEPHEASLPITVAKTSHGLFSSSREPRSEMPSRQLGL